MEDIFQALGLNSSEENCLLALLTYGPAGGADIAKRTGLQRTTAYTALRALEETGVILKRKRPGRTIFEALEPDEITHFLEQKLARDYAEKKDNLEMLRARLKEFPRKSRHSISGLEIRSVESAHATDILLREALSEKSYCSIADPQTALTGEFKDIAVEEVQKSTVGSPHRREILVSGPLADFWQKANSGNPNHLIKLIDTPSPLQTDVILARQRVYMFHYDSIRPMAIEIRHESYYHFMQTVFDTFWTSLPNTPQAQET